MLGLGGALIRARRFFFAAVMLIAAIFAIPPTARSQAALLVLLVGEDVASENFYFSLKLGGNLADLYPIQNQEDVWSAS